MNKLNFYVGTTLLGLNLLPVTIYAANWGPCQTSSGVPHEYAYNFAQTIQNPSDNKKDKVINAPFNLGGTYSAYCECPDPIPAQGVYTYFKAESSLNDPAPVASYYKLNENISVMTKIDIDGHGEQTVPFDNIDNVTAGLECTKASSSWSAGSKGSISIKIIKPFIGQLEIPQKQIAVLYSSKAKSNYGSTPLATVNIYGNITVTQGCEISAGTVLDIPFGEYQVRDFNVPAGQPPQNVRKIQKELSFDCANISDSVKIYLSIEGKTNANYSSAIDIGNADVGAVIEDGKGNILKPNDSNSLLEMNPGSLYNDTERRATTTITAYPVSTTGKLPAVGDYSGIATMHVELE